jgi:hypothetical protein
VQKVKKVKQEIENLIQRNKIESTPKVVTHYKEILKKSTTDTVLTRGKATNWFSLLMTKSKDWEQVKYKLLNDDQLKAINIKEYEENAPIPKKRKNEGKIPQSKKRKIQEPEKFVADFSKNFETEEKEEDKKPNEEDLIEEEQEIEN